MSRGRSTSIIKDRPQVARDREDDKENRAALSNLKQPTDEFRRCKPQSQLQPRHAEASPDIVMIEIRKQQKAHLKELTDMHNE